MKIGVISDIHSNVIAFRACTGRLEAEGCDEYFFLGDFVSDTPYARETLDYLYDFAENHVCTLLRGNREEYMLAQRTAVETGAADQIWRYNSASGNLLYTYELLTDKDLDFFGKLPIFFEYKKTGYPEIWCCHGSPDNTRELLQFGSGRTKRWLGTISCDYLLCAHTHIPGEYIYRGKHCFNPGCTGIAIGDAGYAQCMILQDEESEEGKIWKPEFLRVPYDHHKVVRDIFSCGLLEKAPWFINSNIQILLTGTDHSAEMVALASRLSVEAGQDNRWPLIDETFFEAAADRLGIPDYRGRCVPDSFSVLPGRS